MIMPLAKWEPLPLKGRNCSGGLFWVLFWAAAKEYLASGARPAKFNDNEIENDLHNHTTKDLFQARQRRNSCDNLTEATMTVSGISHRLALVSITIMIIIDTPAPIISAWSLTLDKIIMIYPTKILIYCF
jgi:hypothetical protein